MIISKKGSTSVFLMMTFISILLVIVMLTEVVSSTAARSYAMAIVELAGRSTLSNYNLALKEDYGLFGMLMDETELKDEFLYYAKQTMQPNSISKNRVRLLNLQLKNVEIECDEYSLTNCKVFEKQVMDYMKYRALGNVLMDLNGKKAQELLSRKQDDVDDLVKGTKELENATQLMQKIKPILSRYENDLDKTKKLEKSFQRWQKLKNSDDENSAKEASILEKHLFREWSKIQKIFRSIESQIDEVYYYYGDGVLFGESGKNIIQQIESIREEITFFLSISVDNLNDVFLKLKEEEGKTKRCNLNRQIQSYSNLKKDDKEKETKCLKNEAVIFYLPSQQMEQGSWSFCGLQSITDQADFLSEARNQFLLNQYIFHMFSTQMTKNCKKETFFQNEVEYLLFGEFQDAKNKRKAEQCIFGVRAAANLVYLYSNTQKQRELAAAAASITPGPEAVITQCVLATLWSCAEARNDLNILLEAGSIPFFKSDNSWALTLDSVLSGRNNKTVDKKAPNGLNYNQYLSLFLYCSRKEPILIRMMDLIQINLQGRYDREFLICNCKGGFLFHGEVWKKSILGEPKMIGVIRKGRMVMSYVY
ncbi:MAG: DUF5702 domain-containing protein [Anaerovorax sp.]|nr:DUF5702 domain-containing protein [Anaerovorax sp.]